MNRFEKLLLLGQVLAEAVIDALFGRRHLAVYSSTQSTRRSSRDIALRHSTPDLCPESFAHCMTKKDEDFVQLARGMGFSFASMFGSGTAEQSAMANAFANGYLSDWAVRQGSRLGRMSHLDSRCPGSTYWAYGSVRDRYCRDPSRLSLHPPLCRSPS